MNRWIQAFLLITCLSGEFILSAQNSANSQVQIQLDFPYLKGKEWIFILERGSSQDTIAGGLVKPDGRIRILLSESDAAYCGVGSLLLNDGGGLQIILHGKSFSVSSLSPVPSSENIVFEGSSENTYLTNQMLLQQKLMARYNVIMMALSVYPPHHSLYPILTGELESIDREYQLFKMELATSPTYAARYLEIMDITRGIGNKLVQEESEKAKDIDNFMVTGLDWQALYTSGQWKGVIYNWVQMHLFAIGSDSSLLASARRILAALPNAEMYTSFCEYMARYWVAAGKDSLLSVLAPEVKGSGKLLRTDDMLGQYGALQAGEYAPELAIITHIDDASGHRHELNLLKSGELSPRMSLLVFYQSGCGPCESTMQQLSGNYPLLSDKGVRVLSFAADTDLQVFENTARQHPWPDKYCDEQGMAGPNFRRYGVAGTPTLFLLDADGRVLLRTAELSAVVERLRGS